MKKWLIGIGLVLVIATACIYVFIPRELEVSSMSLVRCNPQAVFRQVGHGGNWVGWWPGDQREGDGKAAYRYAGDVYSVSASSYPLTEVAILHAGAEIKSRMSVLSLSNKDSAAIYWQCRLSAGEGPIQRLRQYLFAHKLKGSMNGVLSKLRPFLEDERNIYGMNIGEASTKDTFLVATKAFLPGYPSTPDIYRLLGELREYIVREGAVENGYPMANVTKLSDSGFQLMAAIPVDRPLRDKGAIFYRRLVPGKFLAAEVKGGDRSVRAGFDRLQEYVSDHQRTVMAIPFQVIVTDRMKEPDTTRWVTRWYCPVF